MRDSEIERRFESIENRITKLEELFKPKEVKEFTKPTEVKEKIETTFVQQEEKKDVGTLSNSLSGDTNQGGINSQDDTKSYIESKISLPVDNHPLVDNNPTQNFKDTCLKQSLGESEVSNNQHQVKGIEATSVSLTGQTDESVPVNIKKPRGRPKLNKETI